MYNTSKKLFYIFLWLIASSLPAIIYFTVISLIFPDGGKSFAWMNIVIFLTGAATVLLYSSSKMPGILKFLLSLIATAVISFGSKYLVETFFSPKNAVSLNIIAFAGIVFGVFLFTIWIAGPINRKFKKYFFLLDAEKDHAKPESYFAWLKTEATGDPKQLEPNSTVALLANFALFLLLLLFVAIVKTPSVASTLTFFTVFYAAGSLGVYLVFYQLSSLLKWKLLGYRTDNTIVKNWNSLIMLFLVPIIVIPLVIPWNYSIVKSQALTDFFNNQFSKISLNIANSTLTMNEAGHFNEGTKQWKEGDDELALKNKENFWNVLKVVILVFVAFIVVYTLLAIIGWILLNKYKYAKKSVFMQFLINRYYKFKSFFDVIFAIFSPIGNFFLRIFGLKKPEEEGETQKLEKHLYTYFESIKELPADKQEEIRTIIREFVRFIQTASRVITPYYFFLGPMEYTEKVIDLRPTYAIDLRKVANVFNESRYSLHILSEELKNDYQKIIDILIISIEKEKAKA